MISYLFDDNAVFTSSPVWADHRVQGEHAGFDYLVRVQGGGQLKTMKVSTTPTQTLSNGVNAFVVKHRDDIDLLRSVIYWQKRTIDFQALHTALLLGSMTEEAFEEESDKFVTAQASDVDPDLIASVIERLNVLTGIPYDTSDYASFLQCTQERVMEGLKRLPHGHFPEMLPSSMLPSATRD